MGNYHQNETIGMRIILIFKFRIDPETVLGKMQTDSGLTILDHVSSPKESLDTVDVNLKMPV